MSRFTRFPISCFLVFGSFAAGMFISVAHAQIDSIATWKPNVGDQFICTVSHYSECGDWKCEGFDTLMFEIIDTFYNADTQHQNSVLATTKAIALHYKLYSWGNGWDSTEEAINYPDTTFMALTAKDLLETSFNGDDVNYPRWTQVPLAPDTPVIFQGISYPASASSNAVFLPTLGWFFSLAGYGGYCTSICIEETWNLSLIAAIKVHDGVREANHSSPTVFSNFGVLRLVNDAANNITLVDLLGRTVRSWHLPMESNEQDISLNVADVPSGIYFVRISGDGIDEVKKVCITH